MLDRIKGSIATLFIICVVLAMIVPLPSPVLDFLFILNLALAFTILLISMNVKTALEFSILPSLLLLTTLFRLSLEISATKLILLHDGSAGEVIKAFGQFVVQDQVLVGIVVFLIIVVVQFIVITKGAERVSEVAARFTLDAMPGKQMAIDADLTTGLITEAEAKHRRANIQREADFFGAMDGASKFVKGDAVVAIIIMIINIVGGIVMGLLAGNDISSVFTTYTLATVGEGLMAQIPALLISTSTGIIVTRTASEDNMSNELSKQLFSQPKVLRTTGIVLLLMMLIPSFPWQVLLPLGSLFIFLSYRLGRAEKGKKKEQQKADAAQDAGTAQKNLDTMRNPDNVYGVIGVDPIEMEFGYSLLPLVDESQGGTFIDKVVLFRRQFAMETGVVIPSVTMRDNIQLDTNEYVIRIRGEEVARWSLLTDHLLIMGNPDASAPIPGVDITEPAFGLPAKWIKKPQKEEAEVAGFSVFEPASVMMTHLGEVIRCHVHELLGRQEVNKMLDVVKKNNQTLVDEVVPSKIAVGDLQRVLQNLLREDIPVRDMVTILETIAEHSAKVKDPDLLTEYVRQNLKRTISHRFAPGGEMRALTVDPQVEKAISASVRQTEHGTYLALEPDRAQKIIDSLNTQIEKLSGQGFSPVVVVSPVVRLYFKRLTEQILPDLTVISYNELDSDVKVQAVGAVAA